MQFLFRSFTLASLFTAFLVEGVVIYFIDAPMVRAIVGVLLILPIVWIVARTDVAQMITEMPEGDKKRYYKGLRRRVVRLLDEIRRLNWIAVDVDRGFRDQDEASLEMDQIESTLHGMLSEIRSAAGKVSGELKARPDEAEADTADGTDDPAVHMEATILPAEEEPEQ